MRVIGYSRVSDKEQAVMGYSIDAQNESITEWSQTNGHQLVRIYVEPGRSGSKPSQETRPGFERAVQLVLLGAADALVVKWMDRFARNVEDFIRVRSQLFQAGKNLISINEPMLNGDPADPVARYIAVGIMNAYQLQAELTGKKSALGRDRRAKQGHYPGILPLGYQRINKTITSDLEYSQIIIAGFNEFSRGTYTLDSWVNESKQRGYITPHGKPMSKSLWHRILRNRFYIGYYTWKDMEYLGEFEPLIDEETFNTVQTILDKHSSGPSYRSRFWLLSGLLWSDVYNKLMTGNLAKGKYAYYRAAGHGPEHNVNAVEMEERVFNHLSAIYWDRQNEFLIPENWRLAFKVSNTMQQVFTSLETVKDKQKLLRMIYFGRGIRVAANGRIISADLLPGFKGW